MDENPKKVGWNAGERVSGWMDGSDSGGESSDPSPDPSPVHPSDPFNPINNIHIKNIYIYNN